jgi:methyl-accepting chemotaxis protein/sigma-B regulation protein RsbU (phosphoserine phosphatase)
MMTVAVGILLLVSLIVMFHFSWLAMKTEAQHDAEQTLEGTSKHIDNILMSVEQSSGNIYFDMIRHLDDPEQMYAYARRVVESNRYIVGCAIVFKPDYYPGRKLFMAYIHRKDNQVGKSELVRQETFTNRPYTEQVWYTEPMEKGMALWTDPLKNEDTEDEPLVTFCLPIYDKSRTCVGVMAADLPLSLLTQIVLSAKPSPNGYSTLLANNGSFIVHPDSSKLKYQTVFYQMQYGAHPSKLEAAEAMVAGEEGFKAYYDKGERWYVFYKPFKREAAPGRIEGNLGWSVGVVYPNDDIFGVFNKLLYILMAIAFGGLVLFFILCQWITHRQLLPLRLLTRSARHIAKGNYDETIPDTNREDEIGRLQDHFQNMQRSLAGHMGQLEKLSTNLKERNKELAEAYRQAQKADKMKTAFLHNMTNQLVEPSNVITANVSDLCKLYDSENLKGTESVVETIRNQSMVMVDVLKDMLQTADKDIETGGAHE